MKAQFRNGNYKIQWFEWAMLLLSFGVIVEALRFASFDDTKPGRTTAGGIQQWVNVGAEDEQPNMVPPATWHQVAEDALLVELTLASRTRTGQHGQCRDWEAYGIPADELAFFDFWQKSLDTVASNADGRLLRLLEARQLYQSVGELMRQQQEQADFFSKMETQYQIPAGHAQLHYLENRPSTTGQWATFVA